jgi:SpoVK/Ycf46/Vps4 family AAA+-type ATPase
MTAPCVMVLEDIDSMIDDENRSFFLNELDGFENNTGLVVLATTNHPDRLDPAILNRPSRFDRKYYFDLPAAAERLAYVAAWNNPRPLALQRPSVRTGSGSDPVEVTQVGMSQGEEGGLAPAPVRTGSGSDRITGGEHLHPELRLSERAIKEVVEQTEDFSFAYMKELFVSATMQWMSTREEILDSTSVVLASTSVELPNDALPDGSTPLPQRELRPRANAPLTASIFGEEGGTSMDEIILNQAARLRAQMGRLSVSSASSTLADGTVARVLASARRFLRALHISSRESKRQ